jgi:hypothetical protein
MADAHNERGIRSSGLLSTSALLDLYEYSGMKRESIEREHRPQNVTIEHPVHGTAIVRDQKPLTIDGLRRSIKDGTSPDDFLHFLNGRVFFWLTERRLARMNGARAYRSHEKLVYVVDTESLLSEYSDRVMLSPMNSGATLPAAHPRSVAMFKTIEDFDIAARAGKADAVVELTVEGGVPNLAAHVVRTEIWKGGKRVRRLS